MSYDDTKLVTLLDSTLNPNLRKQAEEELGLVIIDNYCWLIIGHSSKKFM